MGSLFGSSTPQVIQPAATTTISDTDPEVQEAKRKERELARRRSGRSSTILTGPAGLSGETDKKTLLGQ